MTRLSWLLSWLRRDINVLFSPAGPPQETRTAIKAITKEPDIGVYERLFAGTARARARAGAGAVGRESRGAGAVAGCAATLASYPLDCVRSRLMVQVSEGRGGGAPTHAGRPINHARARRARAQPPSTRVSSTAS